MSEREIETTSAGFSAGFLAVGGLCMIGAGIMAARQIWEMTVLSWEDGPQMIGFSFIHLHAGLFVLLALSTLGLMLWLLIAFVRVIRLTIKRRSVRRVDWILTSCGVVVFALLSVPEGAWDRVFVWKLASGPYAADFLIRAAGKGERSVVYALLVRGLTTESRSRDGYTALMAATNGRQPAVLLDLLGRGAHVNAVNDRGYSALAFAVDKRRLDLVDLLRAHGGREIRPPVIDAPPASATVTAEP